MVGLVNSWQGGLHSNLESSLSYLWTHVLKEQTYAWDTGGCLGCCLFWETWFVSGGQFCIAFQIHVETEKPM